MFQHPIVPREECTTIRIVRYARLVLIILCILIRCLLTLVLVIFIAALRLIEVRRLVFVIICIEGRLSFTISLVIDNIILGKLGKVFVLLCGRVLVFVFGLLRQRFLLYNEGVLVSNLLGVLSALLLRRHDCLSPCAVVLGYYNRSNTRDLFSFFDRLLLLDIISLL